MSTTFKPLYGTSNQPITITLASLGASATVGREGTVVDNTTALYVDILLSGKFETGVVSGNKQVLLYLYGTTDGGTTYTETVTGSDAGITRKDPTMLIPLRTIPAPTATFVHKWGPFSLAAAFGGVIPQKWGVVFFNDSGVALSATAGNNAMWYQGVQLQSV